MVSNYSKNVVSLVLFLLAAFSSFGQVVDFDRVVTPAEFKAKSFEDYLVQLAWNNTPERKVLDLEVAIAKEEQNIQRWEWTKDLTAQFNYNEAHFITDFFPPAEDDTNPLVQSLIFPRFNFGARISLGTLLNYKNEKEIAKLKTEIAQTNINQAKLEIRAKVLEAYANYKTAEKRIKLRIQAEQEASQAYQLATALFKAGEAQLDEFTASATTYFDAKEATLEARAEAQMARIQLEELIGVSLEEAKRFGPREEKGKKRKKR